jgi:membrane-bound metal-dependent hydrolase YbcI (DUF457 family)
MMGPTHALSGAALWLGGIAIAQQSGMEISTEAAVISTAICAGSALLPDIDEPQSTIARSFGPVSQLVSYGVNKLSELLHNATLGARDRACDDGHRKITHTILGAILLGSLVSVLTVLFGKPVVLATFFVTFGLALRGLIADAAQKYGWIGISAITLAATAGAYLLLPSDTSPWWIGIPVAAGMILHDLGDMVTKEGAPLLAPLIPINGKRWWEVALPSFLRIRAGSWVEYSFYGTAFGIIFMISAAAVFTDINIANLVRNQS